MMRIALFISLVVSQLSFASGWNCKGEEGRWDVRIINHIDPYLGTTNPSQFIVLEEGTTLIHRFSPHIDFLSTSKGTTYKTVDTDNVYSCVVNFHIAFREGVDSVPAGTRRAGTLFFSSCADKDEESTHKLVCRRYLKNP